MVTASSYQAESDFCFSVSNLMLKKYKGQIETKRSTFYHQMRIAIHSKKQFRSKDIEYIVQCLNEEFDRFPKSRFKWILKTKIESRRVKSDFLFSVVFVYSKNNNNESRYCWQTLS